MHSPAFQLPSWDLEDPFAPVPCDSLDSEPVLSLSRCDSTSLSQRWYVSSANKTISLQGNSSYCWSQSKSKTDPNSGQPSLTLVPCSQDSWLHFEFGPSDEIIHSNNGLCVDLTFCGGSVCSGSFLELYACGTPHGNQQFTYDAVSGFITLAYDETQCVTACDTASL